MTTNQHRSDWRDGFLFLGNDLTLDFLNTRPVQDGQATELLPDFAALLRWFRAADLLTPQQAADIQERWAATRQALRLTEEMRSLRERLRKEIFSWQATGRLHRAVIDELNGLMARYPMRTRLKSSATGMSTESFVQVQRPEDLFAPLAQSAATLFATADRERIRKCASCVLLFRDVSKKGTRHWCSMQLCGNRVKVAAYAARKRTQSQQGKGRKSER